MSKKIKIDKRKLTNILEEEMITQKQFAEKINLTPLWISCVSSEDRKRCLSIPSAKKILKFFADKYLFEDIFYYIE